MTKILVALHLTCNGHAATENTHFRNAYKACRLFFSAPANTADTRSWFLQHQCCVFQKPQKPGVLHDGNTPCFCTCKNKGTKQFHWYIQSSDPTVSTNDKMVRQKKQKTSLMPGLMHAAINSDIQIHEVLNKHKIVFLSSFKKSCFMVYFYPSLIQQTVV